MNKNFIILLLVFCQTLVFAQDKKVMKIAKYIEKGKGTEAKELLDELDSKKEYQSDIYYWYVRTVYYRNAALANTDSPSELAEARKSFEKLVEFDKTDQSKSFTQYIPQIRKDLYEGKNQISKSTGSSSSISQANDNGKTVTLTQIGQGKTKDAAKYNALRNAIEKAFGTFISSNTTLLNDELVKDEIVSVSTGNIQNFEILSETQMPNGSYSSVVKATVSIVKLTSFCESKGIVVEFKGGLFAANIKLQELNKKNEEAVMANLFKILDKIVMKGFDFKIEVSEPKKDTYNDDKWIVNFSVTASGNKNLENIKDITMNTIKNICLSPQEIIAYSNQNLSKYSVKINGRDYYFRSSFSTIYLRTIFEKKVPLASLNFSTSDGLNKYECISLIESNLQEGRTIQKKSDWPCLCNNCEDCGYEGSIKSNYKTNIYKFLGGINPSNFQSISDSYSSYDSRFEIPNIDLEIFNSKEIVFAYDRNTFPIEIIYYFQKTYSMDQLSKITEYKVQPIIK
ncbi:hypothetical protein GCM10022389_17590 [Flavobacterium cheonanense]|uniref:Uncharacterized protein n=1 Tax=Flavobacterium cheonanense TaxID=706183 RepID=A0ABP7VR32_9FLAO